MKVISYKKKHNWKYLNLKGKHMDFSLIIVQANLLKKYSDT